MLEEAKREAGLVMPNDPLSMTRIISIAGELNAPMCDYFYQNNGPCQEGCEKYAIAEHVFWVA